MERVTQRSGQDVTYIGQHTRLPGIENASSMRVAATREVMQRLAAYEDTGLTPEEIKEMQRNLQINIDKEKIAKCVSKLY